MGTRSARRPRLGGGGMRYGPYTQGARCRDPAPGINIPSKNSVPLLVCKNYTVDMYGYALAICNCARNSSFANS